MEIPIHMDDLEVHNGNSYSYGWFGDTPILGKPPSDGGNKHPASSSYDLLGTHLAHPHFPSIFLIDAKPWPYGLMEC